MQTASQTPIHLLIRFSDRLFTSESDTITEHNQIIASNGAVWFGKMGSPVTQRYIDLINQQTADGIVSYLYMVKGNRRQSTAFRGTIVAIAKVLPEGEERLVPSYYAEKEILDYMQL